MFTGMNKYGRGGVLKISTVFPPFCHVFSGRDLLNWISQTFIEPPFSETVISEIHRLWGSPFFPECSKFNVDFENAEKN